MSTCTTRSSTALAHDFAACFRMGREYTVVAQKVEARRRDQGDEPSDEVERIEKHCMGAVTPSSLESIQQTLAVGRELEAFLRDRRARDVSAQPLESSTISTVDRRARVHVYATDVSERLTSRRGFADRMHELASALAGRSTQQLGIIDRRAIARCERRLVLGELVGGVVEFVE